jgi:hypothetical protein
LKKEKSGKIDEFLNLTMSSKEVQRQRLCAEEYNKIDRKKTGTIKAEEFKKSVYTLGRKRNHEPVFASGTGVCKKTTRSGKGGHLGKRVAIRGSSKVPCEFIFIILESSRLIEE